MSKFYQLIIVILIFIWLHFSFVVCRFFNSPPKLVWPRKSGTQFELRAGDSSKDIYPEKEYWTPPEDIEENQKNELVSKSRQSRDFAPIRISENSHKHRFEIRPKKEKLKKIADTRESHKLRQEVSSEKEGKDWSEMAFWPQKNDNNKHRDKHSDHGQQFQPMEEKHYNDDEWKEDNSIKEIQQWRDPARNEDIVWKKKYTELGNLSKKKISDRSHQKADKDIPQWKEKKSKVLEPQWKMESTENQLPDSKITNNKARLQEEDIIYDVGQPEEAKPRKEFDAGRIVHDVSKTKFKEILARQFNTYLEDKDTEPTIKKRHHSKKSKSKTVLKDNKKTKNKCVEKCFTPKCEVECMGRQASAACSAESCSALTTGQDSASLCTGELCHAMCFKTQCIAACEGAVCFGKCQGKACHAVAQGRSAQSMCMQDECMAYANGEDVNAKCSGKFCHAQCVGPKCTAICDGKECVAGCSGHKCISSCLGKDCQHFVHKDPTSMTPNDSKKIHGPTHSSEEDPDDGYYGNKNHANETSNNKNKKKNDDNDNGGHRDFNPGTEEQSGGNLLLNYAIGIRFNEELGKFLAYKLRQLKDSSLLRQLPKLTGLF